MYFFIFKCFYIVTFLFFLMFINVFVLFLQNCKYDAFLMGKLCLVLTTRHSIYSGLQFSQTIDFCF